MVVLGHLDGLGIVNAGNHVPKDQVSELDRLAGSFKNELFEKFPMTAFWTFRSGCVSRVTSFVLFLRRGGNTWTSLRLLTVEQHKAFTLAAPIYSEVEEVGAELGDVEFDLCGVPVRHNVELPEHLVLVFARVKCQYDVENVRLSRG